MSDLLPELQPLVDAARRGTLDLSAPVAQLREEADAGVVAASTLVRPAPGVDVRDDHVRDVPVRIYSPPAADGRRVHVHLHGGGWWMGSLETTHAMARELAAASGLTVVSVGYRLAPEHPFPAGLDDVMTVLARVADDGASVSVGGESAGANLAAAAALRARDEDGPALVAQWLDLPAVDLTLPSTPSLEAFGSGYGLDVAPVRKLIDWYVPSGDLTHPYVSPLRAPDLSGLPPALITTAELDPVRDQGAAYARALEAAGVPVRYLCSAGHLHGTTWLTALTASAADWHAEVVETLVAMHESAQAVTA